ncbi:MAG: hypothetical protein V4574_07865 [Pseudomonadota bacterium]
MRGAAALLGLAALSGCGNAGKPAEAVAMDNREAAFAAAIAPLYGVRACPIWTPAELEPRELALMTRRAALVAAIDRDPALRRMVAAIRQRAAESARLTSESECASPPLHPRPEDISERSAQLDAEALEIGVAERAYAAFRPSGSA